MEPDPSLARRRLVRGRHGFVVGTCGQHRRPREVRTGFSRGHCGGTLLTSPLAGPCRRERGAAPCTSRSPVQRDGHRRRSSFRWSASSVSARCSGSSSAFGPAAKSAAPVGPSGAIAWRSPGSSWGSARWHCSSSPMTFGILALARMTSRMNSAIDNPARGAGPTVVAGDADGRPPVPGRPADGRCRPDGVPDARTAPIPCRRRPGARRPTRRTMPT